MEHAVIGIFHEDIKTREAIQQLIKNGFKKDKIDICETREYYDSEKGFAYKDHGNKIGDFMRYLFGTFNPVNDFTEVAMKGSVVTVHAETLEEAERAVNIMDRYGAVDWSERSAHYRSCDEGERLPLRSRIVSKALVDTERLGYPTGLA